MAERPQSVAVYRRTAAPERRMGTPPSLELETLQ